jgi:hypothetical protein
MQESSPRDVNARLQPKLQHKISDELSSSELSPRKRVVGQNVSGDKAKQKSLQLKLSGSYPAIQMTLQLKLSG